MEKIGVGIITCNREGFFEQCFKSLPHDKIGCVVVINDGRMLSKYTRDEIKLHNTYLIENESNLGVGKSKNKALQFLLDKECDNIFLIEDDLIIKDSSIFTKYIEASKATGIQHFNYGPGTPFNRKQNISNCDLHNRHLLDNCSIPNPKLTVEYKNNIKISLYEHIAGVFSFFTRSIINRVGLIDEDFINAWEHVEHTYRIILANGHPPFWWFADIADSEKYLEVQKEATEKSSIAKDQEKWLQNVRAGREIYFKKHGLYPNTTPLVSESTVVESLKKIKNKWTT